MKTYYIYILASGKNGTLYLGVTNNLVRRVRKHKEGHFDGFTKKYGVNQLVYFEECNDIRDAIEAEKRIKEWKRKWKLRIIEKSNPNWKDLYNEIS